MKTDSLIILVIASTLCCAGCVKSSYPQEASGVQKSTATSLPDQGTHCTVQFRRDDLGASRELPVAPTTSSINGAEVSVSGRFVRGDEEWIVLTNANQELWIPRPVILLMIVDLPQKSAQNHDHGDDQPH